MKYFLKILTLISFYAFTLIGMEDPYADISLSIDESTFNEFYSNLTTSDLAFSPEQNPCADFFLTVEKRSHHECCCRAIFNSLIEKIQHIESIHTFHRNITNEELEKYYVCTLCSKEFFDINDISAHKCTCNNTNLNQPNDALAHELIVEELLPEITSSAILNNTSEETLDLPPYVIIKKTPEGIRYFCTICNKIIKSLFYTQSHIRLHQNYFLEFEYLISLKKPFSNDISNKPFYCPTCNSMKHMHLSTLLMHIRKQHLRNFENSQFVTFNNATHKDKIDTFKTPRTVTYPDSLNYIPSEIFNLPDYLITKQISDEIFYICTICNKTVKKMSDVQKHIYLHHKYAKEINYLISFNKPFCDNKLIDPFYCPICYAFRFSNLASLLKHVIIQHPRTTSHSQAKNTDDTSLAEENTFRAANAIASHALAAEEEEESISGIKEKTIDEKKNKIAEKKLERPDYVTIKQTPEGMRYECIICNKFIKNAFHTWQHINLHQKNTNEFNFLISLKKPFCDNNLAKSFFCPLCPHLKSMAPAGLLKHIRTQHLRIGPEKY